MNMPTLMLNIDPLLLHRRSTEVRLENPWDGASWPGSPSPSGGPVRWAGGRPGPPGAPSRWPGRCAGEMIALVVVLLRFVRTLGQHRQCLCVWHLAVEALISSVASPQALDQARCRWDLPGGASSAIL